MCSAAAAEATGSGLPGGSVPTGAAARRVAALFVRQPALCLERAVGEKHGIDQNLWDSCHFQAEIYPDLPLATTWRDLLRRTVQTAGHESEVGRVEPPPKVCPAERWTVRTVAAQLRSRDQLRSMMLSAAGVDPAGDPKPGVRPADALLFVSGSHPARHLPGAGRWLQDSFDLLLLASAMREEGYLPASLSLWAVENPMLAPVKRLRQKADAGAEVVVTQPALLWDRVQRWADEADRELVSHNVKVMLGLPIVPSIGNLDFWLRLCNVRGLPEAQALLQSFPQSEERDRKGHAAAVRQWNADLIRKSLSLPGVAGLHVMPLTKLARQMTLDFLADGTLPSRF
ncbi:hypothetical protein CHLNCDRAFT_135876 [Chlorella variabilis]|uniref:Uncharacterized protein n=1 Tax=Chlorella variabilis TaxID=554065 RepID=E1ZJ72_CHLVA|nr:hypothetical protein CHLNCDRAFT_135876 [Chlorella variabilis]EFN54450.1 hypothetical protein CHLNCDRAFT_135876 [Chlorella variabilis]|eukprot:XP_005846552.1 hypothetical protein CHLNCDRAFT_135876 [Chlorella variabilis]